VDPRPGQNMTGTTCATRAISPMRSGKCLRRRSRRRRQPATLRLANARTDQRHVLYAGWRHSLAHAADALSAAPDGHRWFTRFRDDGTWKSLNHHLVMLDRERAGRDVSPSAGVIDTQSVKTTEAGGRVAMTPARVRFEGVHHLWRKVPSGELSIDPEADERRGWATGLVEANSLGIVLPKRIRLPEQTLPSPAASA
jgi:transposase